MIEFESSCFLQNHKTGRTLPEAFLRKHCCEDIIRYVAAATPRDLLLSFAQRGEI